MPPSPEPPPARAAAHEPAAPGVAAPEQGAPAGPPSEAAIEAAKRASAAQLLFRCARLMNDLGVARVRARTGQPIRAAHTNLFPHIDLEGTRLTVLARRVGVSKQAVAQLVDELVAMGTLEKVPDPTDGRARLIRFQGGGAVLIHGLALLGELEADLAGELGADRMEALREILLALQPLLEARAAQLQP